MTRRYSVDQAEPGERLDERGAAMGHDLAAGLAPESGYLLGEVAAGDPGSGPHAAISFYEPALYPERNEAERRSHHHHPGWQLAAA
jgi:hypothetical protein